MGKELKSVTELFFLGFNFSCFLWSAIPPEAKTWFLKAPRLRSADGVKKKQPWIPHKIFETAVLEEEKYQQKKKELWLWWVIQTQAMPSESPNSLTLLGMNKVLAYPM